MRWWLRPDCSSSSASVARWNSRPGSPSKLDPTSLRSDLRLRCVNGTPAILEARAPRSKAAVSPPLVAAVDVWEHRLPMADFVVKRDNLHECSIVETSPPELQ